LSFPAQPGVDRQVADRLPGVLDERGRLPLHDRLGAGFLDRAAADAGLLEVEENGAGDGLPRGTRSRLGRGAAGALDVVRVVGIVEEPVRRAEDEAAVAETDERLDRVDPVPLGADLDRVVAGDDR